MYLHTVSSEGYNTHLDGNPEALLSEEPGIDLSSEWLNGWSWVAWMLFRASHPCHTLSVHDINFMF